MIWYQWRGRAAPLIVGQLSHSLPPPLTIPPLKSVSDSSGSWFQESVVFFNSFLGTLSTPECQIFGLFDQTLIHICTLQTVFLRSWMKSSSLQDPPLDRTRAGAGAHKTSWSPLQWTCSPAPPPATSPPPGWWKLVSSQGWCSGAQLVVPWWWAGGCRLYRPAPVPVPARATTRESSSSVVRRRPRGPLAVSRRTSWHQWYIWNK